jgi:hypothetical protein
MTLRGVTFALITLVSAPVGAQTLRVEGKLTLSLQKIERFGEYKDGFDVVRAREGYEFLRLTFNLASLVAGKECGPGDVVPDAVSASHYRLETASGKRPYGMKVTYNTPPGCRVIQVLFQETQKNDALKQVSFEDASAAVKSP